MSDFQDIREAVIDGETKEIETLVQQALDQGAAPDDIIKNMTEAMGVIGDQFSQGEIFLPEMLMSAKTMSQGVELLKPLMAGDQTGSQGTCIIGTVEGDLHDIGKRLVAIMIESAGFHVVDLGVDVPQAKWLEAVQEHPDTALVACSGLLSTTLPAMKAAVAEIKGKGPGHLKVIVGGASVSKDFAHEMGADGYAGDAGAAAVLATELVQA